MSILKTDIPNVGISKVANVYRFYSTSDPYHAVLFICKAFNTSEAKRKYVQYNLEVNRKKIIANKNSKIGIHCTHLDEDWEICCEIVRQ